MFYWLLFNTNLSRWLINKCWIAKLHKQTKKYNYSIVYNEEIVYMIDLMLSKQNNQFISKLYQNNKCLTTIKFNDPIEWYEQLCKVCRLSPDVDKFVQLLLSNARCCD